MARPRTDDGGRRMSGEHGDVERFRALLGHRLGLSFEDSRLASLAELLGRRGEGTPGGAKGYLARLDASASVEELRALARELTVPETYFFRNNDSFRALVGAAIPERMQVQATTRRLRILSAGCASGEEPYSLAMSLRAHADAGWNVSIHALDINGSMLEKAARARYTAWALRETPPDMLARWFRKESREFVLDERVRKMVTFEERNISKDDPGFWQADAFDVIFCRNVVMYFTPEAARATIARLSRSLLPGGFLFLGHAETMRGLSHDFHLRHTHETFYYAQKDGSERAHVLETASADPPSPRAGAGVPVPDLDWAEAWVETVRRSSERIAELSAQRPLAGPDPIRSSAANVAKALELLGEERFAEAKAVVGALPDAAARDPDVLLLRAVLLTHGGDLQEAESVCAQLLSLDELSAGAHYLMALCRESSGDLDGAAEHDKRAVYLDPTFAMPRLHLGSLARRAGDREGARHGLEQALVLLEREDASRVLLFGGGFRREALVAVCRAQILSCGGTA